MPNTDDVAEQARQRDLVRRGYDAISLAYRSHDGAAAASSAEDVSRYAAGPRNWLTGCHPALGFGPGLRCGVAFGLRPASVDTVLSFYALIHGPELSRISAPTCSGIKQTRADTGTCRRWLSEARFTLIWDRRGHGNFHLL